MKKATAFSCAIFALGFTVAAGAQTTTSGTTAAQTTTADKSDIMITGCLQRSSNGNFILTNARMDNDMSRTSTTGTSGTTSSGTTSGTTSSTTAGAPGATTADAAMSSWSLQGGSDLDRHVGHRIQVTGRAIPASSVGASGSTTTGTSGSTTSGTTTSGTTSGSSTTATTDQTSGMNRSMQKLDVKSIKMVAASCS